MLPPLGEQAARAERRAVLVPEETGAHGPGDARAEHDVRALRPGEDRRVLRLGAELLELLALHEQLRRGGARQRRRGRSALDQVDIDVPELAGVLLDARSCSAVDQ
ncbi:hypothetical protein WME94_06815 [Sorangium sp. So ce429]